MGLLDRALALIYSTMAVSFCCTAASQIVTKKLGLKENPNQLVYQ